MLEAFYNIVLFFNNFHFWGPFLVLGVSYIDRRAFSGVCLVVFVSSFINMYLKSLWQIPLDPILGKDGWAFPSGHAQFNFVLWTTLAWQMRKKWVYCCGIAVNVLGSFAMVHFHYHNWIDIAAGMGFGALVTVSFAAWYYFTEHANKNFEFGVLGICACIILYLMMPPVAQQKKWLFMYFGVHLAATLHAWILQKKGETALRIPPKFWLHCAEGILLFIAVLVYTSLIRIPGIPEVDLVFYSLFFGIFSFFGLRFIIVKHT
jgi:membrane-associated phospholipid phosphatase